MDKGSIILEPSRDPVTPRTRQDLFITMEATLIMEEVRITIVAPRMAMVMEEVADRTVPTRQQLPRRLYATLLATSVKRLYITPMNVLKLRMETGMEALGRSPTLSPGVK